MKYFYQDEKTGERIEVPLERWVWGAIYHPTEAQVQEATRKTTEERKRLVAERVEKEATLRKEGGTKEQIHALREAYQAKVDSVYYQPEQDEIRQFEPKENGEGVFHRIGEVDQSRISLFVMHRADDATKRYDVVLPEGAKLIHLYRNIKPYYAPEAFKRVYVFGWKMGDAHAFHFILPDDRMIMSPIENVDLIRFNV